MCACAGLCACACVRAYVHAFVPACVHFAHVCLCVLVRDCVNLCSVCVFVECKRKDPKAET